MKNLDYRCFGGDSFGGSRFCWARRGPVSLAKLDHFLGYFPGAYGAMVSWRINGRPWPRQDPEPVAWRFRFALALLENVLDVNPLTNKVEQVVAADRQKLQNFNPNHPAIARRQD